MAKLVWLGRLADLAGAGESGLAADPPIGWSEVIEALPGALAESVKEDRVRIALNGALIADKRSLILSDGDELAFLPPVSGG